MANCTKCGAKLEPGDVFCGDCGEKVTAAASAAKTVEGPTDPKAQYELGYNYANGKGVEQDYSKAIYWYTKSAEQGYAAAQNNLGVFYYYGRGIPKNESKAVEWFTRAAEKGNATAQTWLASCFENGNGVTSNKDKAEQWYTKAAEQGDTNAKSMLGTFYFRQGTRQEQIYDNYASEWKFKSEYLTIAAEWYRKAADLGNIEAQNKMGDFYFNGNGVKKDYVEAIKWYRKAAEQGNANSQYMLGYCYEGGKGVLSKDKVEATKWYTKAAEQGLQAAKDALNQKTFLQMLIE